MRDEVKKIFVHFLIFFSSLALLRPAAAANFPHHVQIRLIPRTTAVQPGEDLPVAIEETIDPGWHTYWINPGDAGQAPDVTWTLPPGYTAGALKFPAPERTLEGPLATYGYHDAVTLLQTMKVPKALAAGLVTLTAHIGILVCKDICIPEQGDYSLVLNDGTAVDNTALIAAAQSRIVDETAGLPATFREQNGMLVLTIKPAPANMAWGFTLIPADWGVVDNAQPATGSIADGALVIRQKRGERALAEVPQFHVLVGMTNKDGQETQAYAAVPTPALAKGLSPAGEKGDFREFAQAILFAFVGGMILNLMPCVFPVLSLKALKLCSLSGQELRKARHSSLLYTAGILASFGGLALLLAALRAGGAHIGWGFQLQDPRFVLPLAWLLFVIGLNLSGYFEIGGRLANAGNRLTQGHGAAASFFTGVLAAVVATPCTAPFMAVAIGYALTQGTLISLAVFLALGFGLALPFLLIAYVPALQRRLPKPGHWMVTFRQLLAFPLFLSAAWLTWVFSLQAGPNAIMVALTGAVLIVLAFWLLARRAAVLRGLALPAALAAFALIPLAGQMEARAVHTATANGDWAPFTAAGFSALEKGDDAIFVDMSAAWCITCKVNENAVLDTPAIMALFHAHHVRTLRGDWTNRNPDVTDFLNRHGRDGVPLYVFYGARDKATKKRPDPVILPQLLAPGLIETAVGP